MAHETQGDTVEDLERIEKMLMKRVEELVERRGALEHELKLVREKMERLRKGA